MVVHRKRAEFEGRSRVTTWLYGICYRVASEYHRRSNRKREQLSDELPEAADPSTPELSFEGREAREKLDEVLDQLDGDKRAVLVLYELDEVPAHEIAERLGIPTGTVYSRLKSAREDFARALARLKARWAHSAGGSR